MWRGCKVCFMAHMAPVLVICSVASWLDAAVTVWLWWSSSTDVTVFRVMRRGEKLNWYNEYFRNNTVLIQMYSVIGDKQCCVVWTSGILDHWENGPELVMSVPWEVSWSICFPVAITKMNGFLDPRTGTRIDLEKRTTRVDMLLPFPKIFAH